MRIWLEALWMWGVGGLQVHGIRSRRLVYKEVVAIRSYYKISYFWWCWLLWLNPGARGKHLTSQLSWVVAWSHTCLPCLPSGRTLLFWSDLFVVGRWWAGEGRRVVSWESGKDGRVVRWQGRKSGRVVRWQGGRSLVLFEGGGQIMLYCFREVESNQGFTTGTWYYLYNGLGVTTNMCISGLMVSASKLRSGDSGSFSGKEGYELTFQFFWGF